MEPPREGQAGRIGLAPGQSVGANVLVRLERTVGDVQIWLARTTTFPQQSTTVRARAQDVIDRASPFAAEIQLGQHLSHPSILAAREAIEIGPWSCVVTAGAPGIPLTELRDDLAALRSTHEPVWIEILVHIAASLLAALDVAHRTSAPDHPKGIVHGGVRPELVEIAPDGSVRLAGFAVKEDDEASRIVDRSGDAVAYLPPEQLGSRTRAPTMDLWSVGALVHELVDGRRFRGEISDPRELYRIALTGVVPALHQPAPAVLEQLRASLLAKNPRERPRSAADALATLAKPSAPAIARLADLVRARSPTDAPPIEAPAAPPAMQDLSQIVPSFLPPPMPEEEGTVAIDPVELAAMRSSGSAPTPAPPTLAEEDAPVMRRRPGNVETPKPQPSAPLGPAPPPTLHIPPPPPLEPARAPEPAPPIPPRAPPTMAGERIDFDPRIDGTSMTIREERRAKRSFVLVLAIAGVVAIVIGVAVGVLIAGDDTGETTAPTPAKSDTKPDAKPTPSGPVLQPRTT